ATVTALADRAHQAGSGFAATVFPLIVVLRKGAPASDATAEVSVAGASGRLVVGVAGQHDLGLDEGPSRAPWLALPGDIVRAVRQVLRSGPRLGAVFKPALGVKTGANEVFLRDDRRRDELPASCRWPAVLGRDVAPFHLEPSAWLLAALTDRGVPLADPPGDVVAYLKPFAGRLARRADARGAPPWALFRTDMLRSPWLVIWRDIAARLEAAPLCREAPQAPIPLNTCYGVAVPDAYTAQWLAAYLNSAPARDVAAALAERASGGMFRFSASTVGALPLPSPSASPRTPPRSSGTWATLCAETLAGIADPLFPALTLAETAAPPVAARAVLDGLLDPLDLPAGGEPLPSWLLPHQADAVHRCRAILRRFGGVLLADGVGVGKTFVALALAALEREEGGDAIAVVPAALRAEWQRASRDTGVPLTLCTHTQLGRGTPGPAAGASLVLVDEAHGFRNAATRRYGALADLTAGRRVALLTATPFNNSPADLAALVQLFAGRDRFRELGVPDLAAALRAPDRGAAGLALAAISVCRSRRLVRTRFPDLDAAFPRRHLVPVAEYDLDAVYAGALEPLLTALDRLAGDLR
ncbi:MAG: hypothetical protein B7Z72_14600, partial [Gemmatimonadetes bacterium 21-71-4]